MNQTYAAGTSRLGIPVGPPFSEYQFLESIYTDAQGVRVAVSGDVGHGHIASLQILGVDTVWMSSARRQQ